MPFQEHFRNFLISDTAVNALIGERLHPRVLPDKAQLPAVVYRTITNEAGFAHDGAVPLRHPRVQLDCYSRNSLEAEAVSESLTAALVGYRGPMGALAYTAGWNLEDATDIYEEETGLYRVSMDFRGFYDAEDEEVS